MQQEYPEISGVQKAFLPGDILYPPEYSFSRPGKYGNRIRF
jgi:hypothetical protein